MKITSLQIENTKRVKAFHLEPDANGLTIIGGKNKQGKTTVLDSIAWLLGGAKYEPSNPQRDGAMNPPSIAMTLDNGIKVERKGKNSALHVTDPSGQRAGQSLLDSFVSQFALNLPKFLHSSSREKAQTLLQIIGIGDELTTLESDEKRIYNERHAIGVIADAKKKHAAELPEYADAPNEPISVSELIQRQQVILAKNGENQRKREYKDRLELRAVELQKQIDELQTALKSVVTDLEIARKSAEQLTDESTAEIESSIANIESINARVTANQAKEHAQDEAEIYTGQYDTKTAEIESIRSRRMALLESANLPLPGLAVVEGDIQYQGKAWDCMSGADQMICGVAIVRKLNPECGFVLMDKLEQFDIDTLQEFNAWLEAENLQVIATRVSTGEECTIIIEDGLPQGQTYVETVTGVTDNGWEF